MFKKTTIAAAVLLACACNAQATELEAPITTDQKLEADTNWTIAGPTLINGKSKNDRVAIDMAGSSLTLTSSATKGSTAGVVQNADLKGNGSGSLTLTTAYTGLGTGTTTIRDLESLKITTTGKSQKGISGYGNHTIENVKHVTITSEDDAVHYGGDASGQLTIRGFDQLDMHGKSGYAIQTVASSTENAIVIEGNAGSTANFSTDKKTAAIALYYRTSWSTPATLSVTAGTIGITNKSTSAYSYGIQAGGKTNATFVADTMTVTASGAAIKAQGSSTMDLTANSLTLTGTKKSGLDASSGSANISLTADVMTITGGEASIQTASGSALSLNSFTEGATAEVNLNGNVAAKGTLTVTNADLHLSAGSTFEVADFEGAGTELILGGFADEGATVRIATNNATDFGITASGTLNDLYANPEDLLEDLTANIAVENQKEGETIGLGAEAGSVADGWVLDESGDIKPTGNPSMAAVANFSAMNLAQWRGEINHLTSRLGDIRAHNSTVGAWARLYGYENEVNDTVRIRMTTRSVQAGADYRLNDSWVLGGAFSYTDADAEFSNGEGNADGYTLAAYASGFFDCGGFVDIIGRIGRISSDVTADTLSTTGGILTGDYDNTALGLSVETGYHWKTGNVFYVEPQAELSYGIVFGDDFTSSTNGVRIEQEDFETLVGRLGVRFGATFNEERGQIYAQASVNHDFLGDADATASPKWGASQKIGTDLGGTWTSFGIGAQFELQNGLTFYGSLDRSNGSDYSEDYRYSVGARYAF